MGIFILILILIYILSFINPRKLTKTDAVLFALLAVTAGFRYGVGTDFFRYVKNFDLINSGYLKSSEPGFVFFSLILSKLGLNSQALFLVFSILTMIFLFKGLKFYINNDSNTFKPVLLIIVLINVFIPSLNVMRQILAASILLYGSRYIIKRNIYKFIFWVVVAICFHYSSLIFLPLYYLALQRFSKTYLLLGLFICFVMAQFGIITLLLEFIATNLSFLDINGYISHYLDSAYNANEFELGIVTGIHILVLVTFVFLKDRLIYDEKFNVIFNFFYIYILSYILALDAYVFLRFNYFFGVYLAIAVSRFGSIFDKQSSKLVDYTLVTLYSLLFLFTLLYHPDPYIIPYNFNFQLK